MIMQGFYVVGLKSPVELPTPKHLPPPPTGAGRNALLGAECPLTGYTRAEQMPRVSASWPHELLKILARSVLIAGAQTRISIETNIECSMGRRRSYCQPHRNTKQIEDNHRAFGSLSSPHGRFAPVHRLAVSKNQNSHLLAKDAVNRDRIVNAATVRRLFSRP